MISASKFYSVVNALKRKGFTREYVVNLGGRGGITTFLEITKEGCKAIGVNPKPHLTRGGNSVTDIFVTKLSNNFREILAYCRVSLEKQVQGKFCDFVIEGINQTFTIAVEIELSDANLAVNIQKDSERVDFVISTCVDEKLVKKAEEIRNTLPRDMQPKVGICLLSRLLRCQKLSDVVDSEFLKERGL